jgi:hypothetical protein
MKHEIEIPDFPEDLEAVAYRRPKAGEYYLTPDWITVEALHDYKLSHLIVRKKQPRRIVLEETNVVNAKISFYDDLGMWTYWKMFRY